MLLSFYLFLFHLFHVFPSVRLLFSLILPFFFFISIFISQIHQLFFFNLAEVPHHVMIQFNQNRYRTNLCLNYFIYNLLSLLNHQGHSNHQINLYVRPKMDLLLIIFYDSLNNSFLFLFFI
jgi:hypothetical protein